MCCLSFDLRILINPLVSLSCSYHELKQELTIYNSVIKDVDIQISAHGAFL
jgi:hypothetical protein